MKTALITGITGQDGSYLADLLLEKGYVVHGLKRRSSTFNTSRIDHLATGNPNFKLHFGEMTDSTNLIRKLQEIQPDEVYNLGAQSHVHISFENPEFTADSNAIGALRLLEGIRLLGLKHKTKFYQASTSELFGKAQETPQTEKTPFYPRSPYACAKLYAYWTVINYREAYNIFACNGILFNHESPRRGDEFVTKKIVKAVARIKQGTDKRPLRLGNLNAERDWGHAKDYVKGMWLMLQAPEPDDYVLATGVTTTIREFVTLAFKSVNAEVEWVGSGLNEVGLHESTIVAKVDPAFFRPTEVEKLVGDPLKAERKLGWSREYTLEDMIFEMVQAELHKD